MPLQVLHLTGSPTSEFFRELSLTYARGCLEVAAAMGEHEAVLAHVMPGGRWRFPDDLSDEAIAASADVTALDAVRRIRRLAPDLMVPQMFCRTGMVNHRALFDVLEIPYIGNRPAAMALTAHKDRARAVVRAAGVRVPEGEVLRRGETPRLSPPVVVKPCSADNSAGVSLVRDVGEFADALAAAFEHDDHVLVERFVELGREVRCGVLMQDGHLVPLPLEEYAVDTHSRPIRGYDDKIAPAGAQDGGGLRLVAKGTGHAWIVDEADPVTEAAWDAARRCYHALGCRHYGLFDFRIDPHGRPWFLEASLYCSFSPQSVLAVMAQARGIAAGQLLQAMSDEALGRSVGAR